MKMDASALPAVSIITPSFNQGEFIEETIVSVLSQEGDFSLDYIIMDGGSSDNSVEIIKKYDRLLREKKWQVACRELSFRWFSGKDKGQADAINKGLAMANGGIVGWLNSDDTYLPNTISKVAAYLENHPEAVMVYGNAYYTDKEGVVTGSYPSEPFSLRRLAENCFICQPTAFIRTEALTTAGGLDAGLQASMDYELWIRMGEKYEGRITFLEDYLATSRMYMENKTNAIRDTVLRENLAFLRRHFGYVEGVHIASCFYDLYENRHNTSFSVKLSGFRRRLFVLRYLVNVRTLFSTFAYLAVNFKKMLPLKN